MNKKVAKQREEYISKTFVTNEGYEVVVVDYLNNKEIKVEFKNGYTTWCELVALKKGRVKNPYHPSVFGVGYVGVGDYNVSINEKITLNYQFWSGVIERSNDDKFKIKNPTYKDVTNCKDWFNFQNFAKWCEENYYEVEGEVMHLDKDILCKGNKIYSPETCVFVPQTINQFFNKRQNLRGELPIGVTYKSGDDSKFVARCGNPITKKREYLGVFDTPIKAFDAYKKRKEEVAKELATHYKEVIPSKLYYALLNYEVEIDD